MRKECVVRIFIACVSLVVAGIAVQSATAAKKRPEKKEPSPRATGEIKLEVLGLDGKPPKYDSDLLWQKIEPDTSKKYLWHDLKTNTWWEQVGGHSFSELDPGMYRVTARHGHDETVAICVIVPIVIFPQHQTVTTN